MLTYFILSVYWKYLHNQIVSLVEQSILIIHSMSLFHNTYVLPLYLTESLLLLFCWFWPELHFILISLNKYFLCWYDVICNVE